MHTQYDAIYLSPHLDDAALSCGGQIFQRTQAGETILILTIMAGDPPNSTFSEFARELHERWELASDMVAARRAEDIRACHILGADYVHWDIPDCIYRADAVTGEPFYPVWEKVIDSIHQQEEKLMQQLAEQFVQLPAALHILGPLGVGNHVDHQIVRRAAEQCWGSKLFYYEDYPYVQTNEAWQDAIGQEANWHTTQIPLSAAGLAAKAEAIMAFGSQISTFFNGRNDLEQQLSHYAQRVGGERIWLRRE
jgi:LmbE family N-acetylglucosaminyl deacetylase